MIFRIGDRCRSRQAPTRPDPRHHIYTYVFYTEKDFCWNEPLTSQIAGVCEFQAGMNFSLRFYSCIIFDYSILRIACSLFSSEMSPIWNPDLKDQLERPGSFVINGEWHTTAILKDLFIRCHRVATVVFIYRKFATNAFSNSINNDISTLAWLQELRRTYSTWMTRRVVNNVCCAVYKCTCWKMWKCYAYEERHFFLYTTYLLDNILASDATRCSPQLES